MSVPVGINHAEIHTDDLEILICRFEIWKQINFVRTGEENAEQTYKINKYDFDAIKFKKTYNAKY